MEPVYGVREGYAEHNRTPATAASPDPMAKVSAQQLIRRIQKPDADVRRIVVSGKLVIRESVKDLR